MTITKNSNRNVWCDICKNQWGQKADGSWYEKAQQPATWISTSSNGLQRAYCDKCRHYLESWSDGSIWDLRSQQEYRQGKQEINYGF